MNYRIRSSTPPSDNGESWERNTLRDVLLEAYREQRRARIWTAVWRGIGLLVFLSVLAAMFGSNTEQMPLEAHDDHTAVIDLVGEIGGDESVSYTHLTLPTIYSV